MKYFLNFIFTLISLVTLSAQDLRVVEVETNEIISIDAELSWNIVQDWANLHKLAPQAVKSTTVDGHGINSTWEIELINGGSITEQMIYYDSSRRTMSYIMTDTPMPIEDYLAVIKVEPYGIKKSLVSFYTRCKTQKNNTENIKNNFKEFQEIYLSNIKKQNNE